MIGSRHQPYHLHWSLKKYQEAGDELGFDFSEQELREALDTDQRLGIRQFEPEDDIGDVLSIPTGSYVMCHVIANGNGQ